MQDAVIAVSADGLVQWANQRLNTLVLDEDIAEMQRRLPSLDVVVVEGAGHAVQSDKPLVMDDIIRTFAV